MLARRSTGPSSGSITSRMSTGAFRPLRSIERGRQHHAPALRRRPEAGKFAGDLLVDLAPERYHQMGYPAQPFPAPGIELRHLTVARVGDDDLALLSEEAIGNPFLPLAAKLSEPMRRA